MNLIRGISSGSGVSVGEILDLMFMGDFNCSGFIIKQKQQVIHGRNFDAGGFDGLNEFLSEKIEDVPIKIRGNVALAKLFFSRSDSTSEDIVLNIPIACALKFIKERMKLEFKKEPWDLFDDPFIQYIILENIGWK